MTTRLVNASRRDYDVEIPYPPVPPAHHGTFLVGTKTDDGWVYELVAVDRPILRHLTMQVEIGFSATWALTMSATPWGEWCRSQGVLPELYPDLDFYPPAVRDRVQAGYHAWRARRDAKRASAA